MKRHKKAVNFRPMLFVALAVIAGVLFSYFLSFNKTGEWITILSVFFISIIIFLVFYSKDKLVGNIFFVLIVIGVFVFSYFNFSIRLDSYKSASLGGTSLTVSARVARYSKTASGTKYILDNVDFQDFSDGKTDYKLALYIDGEDNLFDIGDQINFYGFITDNPVIKDGKFSVYNVSESVKYSSTMRAENITITGNSKTVFEGVNVAIREELKGNMQPESYKIAYALLTGNSAEMDGEVVNNFRYTGVAHIFAVSGLHIGFVSLVLSFILKKLRANRLITLIVTVAVLTFYSGVCLFTASSLRATVMTAVLLISRLIYKKYDGLSALSFACVIILLFAPMQLFEAGFILSFGIVTGATLIYNNVSKLFSFLPPKIAKTVAFAVSAQLIAIPLSIALFGSFSIISIVTNIIFVPVVGIVYIFLLSALIIGVFGISYYTLFLPNFVLLGIDYLIKVFDYSVFAVGGITLGAGILLYFGAVVVYSGIINLKTVVRSVVCAVLLTAFAVNSVMLNVSNYNALKIAVIGNDYINCTLVSDKGEQVLIVNDATRGFHYGIENALKKFGNEIQTAVIPSGEGADVSNLITGLRNYGVKTVYYSANRTTLSKAQLSATFPDVHFEEITEITVISNGGSKITLTENASLTEIKKGEKRAAVVSGNNSTDIYNSLCGHYELIVVSSTPYDINENSAGSKTEYYNYTNPYGESGESSHYYKIG